MHSAKMQITKFPLPGKYRVAGWGSTLARQRLTNFLLSSVSRKPFYGTDQWEFLKCLLLPRELKQSHLQLSKLLLQEHSRSSAEVIQPQRLTSLDGDRKFLTCQP